MTGSRSLILSLSFRRDTTSDSLIFVISVSFWKEGSRWVLTLSFTISNDYSRFSVSAGPDRRCRSPGHRNTRCSIPQTTRSFLVSPLLRSVIVNPVSARESGGPLRVPMDLVFLSRTSTPGRSGTNSLYSVSESESRGKDFVKGGLHWVVFIVRVVI